MSETYFLTGALGCIGAWVVKELVERGDRALVFDPGDDLRRIHDLCGPELGAAVEHVPGDVTDYAAVRDAVRASGARKIVHLAGLQVPFCKADPVAGARVNVVGSVNILQAAKELELERVVYASSAAVYGPVEEGEVPSESDACEPLTHYGVYKRANEGNARIFWTDDGVSSVGLRPLTVYGVGRDQGLTSGPTSAMKAAVLGRPFSIGFRGATDYQFAGDVARIFLECADRAPDGAHVFNLHGDSVPLERVVAAIEANAPEAKGTISWDGPELPIPPELDAHAIDEVVGGLPNTPFEEGVQQTMSAFRALHAAGRLDTRDLDN